MIADVDVKFVIERIVESLDSNDWIDLDLPIWRC